MSSATSVKDKVAIVTGGTKNLGALVARELAAEGVTALLLHYHSAASKADGEALAKELGARNVRVQLFQGDLSDAAVCEAMFAKAIADFGGVDIAINNVGKVVKKPMAALTPAEFNELDDANNKSAFFFLQSAARHVRKNGKIVAIVTSLLAAFTGYYGGYAGTKAPVEHYVRALAKELADKSISVNAVAPGPMDTPFFYAQETAESVAYLKSAAMEQRLTAIEDIAPIITFLCTKGRWISGQTIFANGGFTAR